MKRKIFITIAIILFLGLVSVFVFIRLDSKYQFSVPYLLRNKPEMTSESCKQMSGRVVIANASMKSFCESDEDIKGVVNDVYESVSYTKDLKVC